MRVQIGTVYGNGSFDYDLVSDVDPSRTLDLGGRKINSCAIIIYGKAKFNNYTFYPCFEIAESEIESFEKPVIDNYTLSLGSTYYGGSVNFKTGVMTVTWGADAVSSFSGVDQVLDRTVAFRFTTSSPHVAQPGDVADALTCNRFPAKNSGGASEEYTRFSGGPAAGSTVRVYLAKSRLDVSGAADPSSPTNAEWLAAAAAWLGSNSTVLIYQLNTPQTVELTPEQVLSLAQSDPYTPQINTVFTDQQGVRVGWQRIDIDSILARLDAIEAQLDG